MTNPFKKNYDKISISKDLRERENIISLYKTTGILDRNEAISKIQALQITDAEMTMATTIKQIERGSVNLYNSANNVIIDNLQFQVDFLILKLQKLSLEGRDNG